MNYASLTIYWGFLKLPKVIKRLGTNLLPSPNFFVVAKSSHLGLFRFELFLKRAQK